MMKLSLGSAPWGVTPVQLGTTGYYEKARKELKAYIGVLTRHYAAEHGGAMLPCRLEINENPHDFGTYLDVVARYEGGASERAASWLEANAPEDWDHVAARELDLASVDDLVWREMVV